MTEPSSTGLEARVAALLCYSVWWVTGLLFLILERRSPTVRFHAAQSLILFGGLSTMLAALGVASAMTLVLASGSYQLVRAAADLVWGAAAVMWLLLVVRAWRGETWRVPLVATLADRLAARAS